MKGIGFLRSATSHFAAIALLGCLLPAWASAAAIPQAERDALLALYEKTDGPSWTTNTNWGEPAGSENTWHGVVTDAGNTTVIALRLADNNLSGDLPVELGGLTNLEELDLSGNALQCPGPETEEVVTSGGPEGPDGEAAFAGAPIINGLGFKLVVQNGVVQVCKLTLSGLNFQQDCVVKIDGQPAPKTVFESDTRVLAKGGAKLKKMLPKGPTFQLTVTNPDGLTSPPYPFKRP